MAAFGRLVILSLHVMSFDQPAYGLSWPSGEYSLPQSQYGCPDGDKQLWDTGFIEFPRPTGSVQEEWMTNIRGPFTPQSVRLNFCSQKLTEKSGALQDDWPPGSYCILAKQCPAGFSAHNLTWTKGTDPDNIEIDGPVSFLKLDAQVTLTLCCLHNSPTSKILLPPSQHFYLFQFQKKPCPIVSDMEKEEEIPNILEHWSSIDVDGKTDQVKYCFYTPIEEIKECYNPHDRGVTYRGHQSITKINTTCDPWWYLFPDIGFHWVDDTDTPHQYCRSPFEEFLSPWCLSNVTVEIPGASSIRFRITWCDIPECEIDVPGDVAGNRPVIQSSTLGYNYAYLTVDGSIDTCAITTKQYRPWLQVNLQEIYKVHAVYIQREKVYNTTIVNMNIYVSALDWDFQYGGALLCAKNQSSGLHYELWYDCPQPLTGQYVTFQSGIYLDPDYRPDESIAELSLCEIQVYAEATGCGRPLGMTSGEMSQFQITASSHDPQLPPAEARLHGNSRWCATDDQNAPQYLQVDMIYPTSVQGLVIQRTVDTKYLRQQYVTNFTLEFGPSPNQMRAYESYPGRIKVFKLTKATSEPETVVFYQPVLAQFLRLTIIGYQGAPCLKMEILGCKADDDGLVTLTTYAEEAYPVVNTTSGKPCVFPYVYQGELQYGCIIDDIRPPWCGTTEDFDRDGKKGDCIVLTKGGNSDGAPCVFPFIYWQPFYSTCIGKSNTANWCPTTDNYNRDEKWGYCIDIEKPPMVAATRKVVPLDSVTCAEIKDARTLRCGWEGIGEDDCLALDCCYDITSRIKCFMKGIPCDDVQIYSEGYFYSPNHPFYYGQLRQCSWTITAPHGQFIKLELKRLNLAEKEIRQEKEDYTIDPGQCADTLIIYVVQEDGTQVRFRELRDAPSASTIISPTNRMRVKFYSCARYKVTEAMGFAAYVHFQECAGCNVGIDRCSTQNVCTAPCAEITSLNYPLPYSANQRCTWNIVVGTEEYIILTFYEFDVRSVSKLCESDGLYSFDFSIGQTEQLIGVFCNYNMPPNEIQSSWDSMRLELSTDVEDHGIGFHASYRSLKYKISDDIKDAIYTVDTACPALWVGYDRSCLRLFEQIGGITWLEAEDQCQQFGGHLLSVQNQKEMDLVHYLLTTKWMAADKSIYIGLNDMSVEGTFKWVDNRPMSFTDWALADTTHVTNEPNGGDNEDCTFMKLSKLYSTASWHDTACSYDKVEHYICEVEKQGINEMENDTTIVLLDKHATCPDGYYQCESGDCILASAFCDGHPDCWDDSDEQYCGTSCGDYNFQCASGGCVSISSFCDYKMDCSDGSDETNCVYPACSAQEFQCVNHQCIPRAKRCDLLIDCYDESDEVNCAGACSAGFQCFAGNCIPGHAKCDGWIDCAGFDHEDETDECLTQRRSCLDWRMAGFQESGNYKIDPDGTGAFLVECNMTDPDEVVTIVHHAVESRMYVHGYETPGSYELPVPYVDANVQKLRALMADSTRCEQFLMYECRGSLLYQFCYYQTAAPNGQNLIQVVFADDEKAARGQCGCLLDRVCREENITECSCGNNQALWKMDSGFIRDPEKLPVMVLNFGDTGHPDEGGYHTLGPLRCYQSYNKSQVRLKCKSGNPIDISTLCLYDLDEYGYIKGCRDATHLENCGEFQCPNNFVKCPTDYCIPIRFLCNGVWDCPNGDDERMCGLYTCPGQYHCRNQGYCIPMEQRCDGVWQCAEGDDELLCDLPCPPGCQCIGNYYNCSDAGLQAFPRNISSHAKKIDLSRNEIKPNKHDLLTYHYLGELDYSNNQLLNLSTGYFSAQSNLYFLDLSFNKLFLLQAGVFVGLFNLETLILTGNAHLEILEKGSFFGLSGIPEVDLSGLNIKSIDDYIFDGLDSVQFLNLSRNKITQLSRNAFDYLETVESLDIQYNTIEEFQRSTFETLISISSLRSDAFKFCCMVRDRVSEANCFPPRDEISSCEDLMKSELLRIFLWIFGLSALCGNAFVLLWRCATKRVSTVNGYLILNLAASDFVMGVYMIIVASADMYYRGIYIEKADKWRHSWLCNLAGFFATFASEASVFALCIITVDRFIAIVLAFHVKRMTMYGARITMAILWTLSAIIAAIPLLPLDYFQGQFYARSGVCVSLHLTNEPRPGWEYSVGIFVGLNFIAFLVISAGYLYMYCVVKQSSQAVGSVGNKTNTRDKELALARKMTLIILTDFFCWAPVIIMSILALSGTKISGDVYAWIIVFVLPVNSAINPYLYTISDLDLIQKVRRLCGYDGDGSAENSTVSAQLSVSATDEHSKNNRH